MAVQPLSAVLSEDQARARCASCFEVISGGGGGSRCSGCKRIWYCSRKCQQADWGEHRPECKAWTSQESGECFLLLFSANVARCLLFVRRAASNPRAAVLRDDPKVRSMYVFHETVPEHRPETQSVKVARDGWRQPRPQHGRTVEKGP